MRTRTDVAWAAGLFEGEGCFSAHTMKKGKACVYPTATIGMTDLDVVERFSEVMGFGTIIPRPKATKPMWYWSASNFETFQATVAFLWPWLGPRRRSRARGLLETASWGRTGRLSKIAN